MINLFLGIIFFVLILINYKYLNLGFLSMYSLDEYAFHGSLLNMYEGLILLNFKKIFKFNFYSYGFVFFFINLLSTLPFFMLNDTKMIIYIPRLISSFFAVTSLFVIYKTSLLYLDKKMSFLILLFVISMPAFWKNACWMHPDWMMTFFIVLSVYFYAIDNWNFKKNFWYANIALGLALATKIQAITFLPFLFLYIFYENFQNKNLLLVNEKIKILLKSALIILISFIITNPHILHPIGMNAFIESFLENMKSNATNHGYNIQITIIDKILNPINTFYLNLILFIVFVFLSFVMAIEFINNKKEKNIFSILAIIFILNISYLLLFVNKNWQHYYLPVFIPTIIFLVPFFQKFKHIATHIMVISLMVQIFTHTNEFKSLFYFSQDYKVKINNYTKISNVLINDIKNIISPNKNILIDAYIPFDYESINLKYSNIHIIYGPLTKEMICLNESLKNNDVKNNCKFKTKDIIILAKDSVYFDKNKLRLMLDQKSYQESLKIIEKLNNGTIGYELFKENEYFYIWRKKQK